MDYIMDIENASQLLKFAMRSRAEFNPPLLSEYLQKLTDKVDVVYLYGAGAFGRYMLPLLQAHGIEVRGFIDRNATPGQIVLGVPVYALDSGEINRNGLVLVSIVLTTEEREPLFSYLKTLGFDNMLDAQSIQARNIPFNERFAEPDYFDDNLAERITSTVSLFADSQSIEIYACNVNCHILRNYENFAESRNCQQYFPNDIPFAKGNSRFVDCGAYIGDTLTELVNNVGLVDTYIGFEPDRDTFSKLAKTASGLRQKLGQAFLSPCAVGRANESLTISGTVGAFTLSETGGQPVQVVRLDDALAAFAPTMLKMDIEGAEVDAIRGASELIRVHHPDLAICVYHKISDYWEIPIMLHELNPNYEFYLRSHSSCTLETVLYATERSRSI